MLSFNIEEYYNYLSNSSKHRAMFINIGNYKLFFSFGHLVAFDWGENGYISTEKLGKRIEDHKTWIENRYSYYSPKNTVMIEQGELEKLISTQVLKVPYRCEFDIYSYHYAANNSKFKAMCVELGNFKLYYSYSTLIGFETQKAQYITNKRYSQTTASHKSSARNYKKNPSHVRDSILKLIVLTNLLKLPFTRAIDIAGVSCERVHFA